jgi:hypothetical protein
MRTVREYIWAVLWHKWYVGESVSIWFAHARCRLVERRRKRAAAQVHKTQRKKLDEIEHKIASLQGTIHFLQNLQRKDLPQVSFHIQI